MELAAVRVWECIVPEYGQAHAPIRSGTCPNMYRQCPNTFGISLKCPDTDGSY